MDEDDGPGETYRFYWGEHNEPLWPPTECMTLAEWEAEQRRIGLMVTDVGDVAQGDGNRQDDV